MPRKFSCPHCGARIVTYAPVGEEAGCPDCSGSSPVPEGATELPADSPEVKRMAAAPAARPPERVEPQSAERISTSGRAFFRGGICLLVLGGLSVIPAITEISGDGVVLFLLLFTPILVVGGLLLLVASRILKALAGISDRLEKLAVRQD